MANFVVFLQCQKFLAQINNPKIGEDSKIFFSPDSNVQTDFTLETEYYLIGSAACCLVSQIIKKSIDLKVIQNCQNRILGWSWKIRKKEASVQYKIGVKFNSKRKKVGPVAFMSIDSDDDLSDVDDLPQMRSGLSEMKLKQWMIRWMIG